MRMITMMLESLTEIDIELKINEVVFAIKNNATASVILSFFNAAHTAPRYPIFVFF